MKKSHLIPATIAIGALYSLALPAHAQPAGPGDPAGPAAGAPVAPAPGAAASPTAAVEAEFPTHDSNGDGKLDQAEFTAWVSKLRAPAPDGATRTDNESWAATLFARADTDQDKAVSKTEMATLLSTARQG